jgi:hypothetical protein
MGFLKFRQQGGAPAVARCKGARNDMVTSLNLLAAMQTMFSGDGVAAMSLTSGRKEIIAQLRNLYTL